MGKVLHTKVEDLVNDLVEAHRALQPGHHLLLAIWFNRDSENDIHLLEVFEPWPDSGLGQLDTFKYGPSATFPLPGRLHLTVAGPKDFRKACTIGHRLIVQARADGEVVFPPAGKKPGAKTAPLLEAFRS